MRRPAPIVNTPRKVLMNNTVTTSKITFEKFLKNLLKTTLFPWKKHLKVFALTGFSIMFGAKPILIVFSNELITIKNRDVKNNPKMILKNEFASLKYNINVDILKTKNGIERIHFVIANLKLCLRLDMKFLV